MPGSVTGPAETVEVSWGTAMLSFAAVLVGTLRGTPDKLFWGALLWDELFCGEVFLVTLFSDKGGCEGSSSRKTAETSSATSAFFLAGRPRPRFGSTVFRLSASTFLCSEFSETTLPLPLLPWVSLSLAPPAILATLVTGVMDAADGSDLRGLPRFGAGTACSEALLSGTACLTTAATGMLSSKAGPSCAVNFGLRRTPGRRGFSV